MHAARPVSGLSLLAAIAASTALAAPGQAPGLAGEQGSAAATLYPLLFVTQVPNPTGFGTIQETFGNQSAQTGVAFRGGDLWMRDPDGTLRNLTAAAGYGNDGFQGASSIVVRDPVVHWDGRKAAFSMAIGNPPVQYDISGVYRFQIYEVTGLGPGETPVITRVAGQPAAFNNIMPAYTADDRILFVSDRPRTGQLHLWPPRDEYELAASNGGIWSLDPATAALKLLDHSPSGDFEPIVDSFGRVVFTRWDHLQRDQLADADAGPVSSCYGGTTYGTFDYSDESAQATYDLQVRVDVYPEPRPCRDDLLAGTNLDGHLLNSFLPWMMGQDGTGMEIINHVGRHELQAYLGRSFNNDPNVVEYYGQYPRANPRSINNFFHIAESPTVPGVYYGIDAPEFATHAAGQVVRLGAPPATNPDDMVIDWVTDRSTSSTSDNPGPEHSGLYRDPLALSDGNVIAAHTSETREDRNDGTTGQPLSRYAFRLVTLEPGPGGVWVAGPPLTPGITKSVTWWSPDVWTSYSGNLWELQPVEVRSRPRPVATAYPLPPEEQSILDEAGVCQDELRAYLEANNLALLVSRNVTTRDDQDRQQPYNLRVPGGAQTQGAPGTMYDVSHLQFYQADMLRGITGCCGQPPQPGRRALARPLHDPAALAVNPPAPGGPEGSVSIAPDGSVAAFVPARRALSWQLTSPAGTGVVRERFWLTFQPGEMRSCASCHGVNRLDQAGNPPPTNRPQALRTLVDWWRTVVSPSRTLRRDATITDLTPVTPRLASHFPMDAGDDYQAAFAPGGVDPEPGILADASRPLVLYEVGACSSLTLVKTPALEVQAFF